MRVGSYVLASVLMFAAHGAQAVELLDAPAALTVDVHGFASQGFILSNTNNYLAAHTKRGSFEFTEVGLNFSKALTDGLRVGFQLFTRDLGPLGNFDAKFDWFYLDYRWANWLGLRAGRVKVPYGLFNESLDIDAALPTILLPQSVYPLENRDFLLAQSGLEVYGYLPLGDAGALDYRAYAGTMFVDVPTQPSSPVRLASRTNPYIAGGRLMYETPLEGLRLGGSLQYLKLNNFFVLGETLPLAIRVPALLWVASAEYAAHDWLVVAEYSRWDVEFHSDNQALFPNVDVISKRAYGLVAYRVTPWLQPAAYYSVFYPSSLLKSGRESVQHDWAATLRFDINSYWLVKVEGHYMRGTAGLNPALNDNTPLADLPERWGVLLIKTTATF